MLYQHHFFGGFAVSGLPLMRRTLSLWGLGAALGLLSFPLRARSSEPDSSEPELADQASELCSSASLEGLPELCDSPAEAELSRDPALLSVLGGDVRPDGLPDLVLSQEGTAAGGGGGLFGLSGTGLALAGGGGLLAVGVLASSGGSDGGGGGGGGNGGGPGPNPNPNPNPDSNKPPALMNAAPTDESPLTKDEGDSATWTLTDWFSDPDTEDTLTFTAMGLPDWLELDSTKSELKVASGATDDEDVNSHVFTITASDDDDATAVLTATLEVENVNEAPVVVTAAPGTITAMEGGAAQAFTVSSWFTDEDTGDTLTYALAAGGPSWATFNTAMGVLSLAFDETDDAEVGSYTLVLTATDAGKLAAMHTVVVAVENTNDAPVVETGDSAPPAMLTAMEGLADAWDAMTWFTDEDAGDELTYAAMVLQGSGESQTAMDLPEWLGLNAMTGALTIAAFAADDTEVGAHTLAVTASDKAGAMVVHTATLVITDTANEPSFVGTLSNRIVPVTGESLVLDLTGAFTDDDEEDEDAAAALTFEISSSVDDTMEALNIITAMLAAETLMLTLTPGTGAASSKLWQQETVAITATDDEGGRGTVSFAVTTRANVLEVGMLAPAHGFIIQGDAGGDELGRSVSGAGDVNGDGIADLIAGAIDGDGGGSDAGEAYIVYGKAGTTGTQFGEAMGSRQVLDTTNLIPADGFIIQGDAANDLLSASVSGAGDVNGDGLADLIVGAVNGDDGESDAGEAYIVYGKTGTGSQFGMAVGPEGMERQVLDTSMLAPADGFILQGDMANDNLGWSAVGAGDINGDGIDDLIAGAYLGDDGGNGTGEAYIVYGKAGDGSQFGMAVRVSATGTTLDDDVDPIPPTSVLRQVLDTAMLVPAAGFIIQGGATPGESTNDRLGLSAAGAGDINGDGLADLIVGAYNGDDGGSNAGEAYIVYGKANPADESKAGTQFGEVMSDRQVLDTSMLAPAAGFIIQGDMAGDLLGYSVSGAGDVNGDGFDDLIAGAYNGDDGGMNAGEAYIIYGKPNPAAEEDAGTQFGTGTGSRQVLDTSMLAPADGFIIQGDAANDFLGWSVSGAGDINGDGLADLIVGAYWGDDGGMDAGEAYIIYGKAGTDGTQFGSAVTTGTEMRQVLDITSLAPTDGFIIQGEAFDQLGISVSGAGDVNGDGFDDLIVGADGGDDGGDGAGEAYVVYGGTHLGEVVSHDQTLVGMAVPELTGDETAAEAEAIARMAFLHGGAGDDRLEAHADTTVLYGGAGNDVLELADDSFLRVDGGSGFDTLVLAASLTLDLTDASVRGRVRGIEAISLSDASAAVTLDLATVYALVESRDNGGTHTSAGEAFLRLEGVGMVALGSGWTKTDNAEGPDLYAQGSAKLLIDDGLIAA